MADTGVRDLDANRWVAFTETIIFEDTNLTGATFAAAVRDSRDGGTLRIALAGGAATATTEGIYWVGYADGDSTISIYIAEASMEAMDIASDAGAPGDDGHAYWDLHVTPSGGTKYVALRGRFNVIAGAVN